MVSGNTIRLDVLLLTKSRPINLSSTIAPMLHTVGCPILPKLVGEKIAIM